MKIYFDENMPYVAPLFSGFGDVVPFKGRECTPQLIKDADVLLVRSITKVNDALLSEADKLKFVGTATIGTDHIDQDFLADREIVFASAPGCNAISVAEYVLSSIKVLEQRYLFDLKDKLVGIVGAGNTGSSLAEKLDALGVDYILCDPPLAKSGDARDFVEYEQLLRQADIISFHVPLSKEGDCPTWHLFGQAQLDMIKPDAIIINACRGEVVDNQVMLEAKKSGNNNPLVLDVWEGEPQVLHELIEYCEIATAHIAGYSFEGKARGTFMLYQALCRHLQRKPEQLLENLLPQSAVNGVSIRPQNVGDELQSGIINRMIHLVYDVRRDDGLFRRHIRQKGFDWLRKNYPVRREFSALTVPNGQHQTLQTLHKLGFKATSEQD